MATNNSHNNTTLDNALEELLNDIEFCRHFDVSHPQSTTSLETTYVTPPSLPPTNIDENVTPAETTPNSLDIGFLNINTFRIQCQTTREVTSSIYHLVETIIKQNNEITPPFDMNMSTDTIAIAPTKISTDTMTKIPSVKSIGTMPMTPTGFKSIGTMSELLKMTSRGTMASPISSPHTSTDIIDLVSPTIIQTIDLCSPNTPTDNNNIN
ncbi:hypothetical protein I4U23_017044 [Adineta vaga]|nr:hypothetical protein I4U23_017044 [Adineta vaga]